MYIIATKKKAIVLTLDFAFAALELFLFGVFLYSLIIASIRWTDSQPNMHSLSIAACVVAIIICIVCIIKTFGKLIRYFKTPSAIAVYENGMLKCGNALISPSQIIDVGIVRWNGAFIPCGDKLKIILSDKTLCFDFVENADGARDRLIQLMLENRENGFKG